MHTLSLKRLLPRRRCPIASVYLDANFSCAEFASPAYPPSALSAYSIYMCVISYTYLKKKKKTNSCNIYIATTELFQCYIVSRVRLRAFRNFFLAFLFFFFTLLMQYHYADKSHRFLTKKPKSAPVHSFLNNNADYLFFRCLLEKTSRFAISLFLLLTALSVTFFLLACNHLFRVMPASFTIKLLEYSA